MPWPNPVVSGVSRILASQYDDLLSAVQAWPAGVSAGGYGLADAGAVSFRTTNASWQEWQLRPVAGSTPAGDAIVFQFNARASAGAADAWANVWNVNVSDGSITFANAVSFLGSVSGLPVASSSSAGLLAAADFAKFSAAAAAGQSWTVDVQANAQNWYSKSANVTWQEFALAAIAGASAAADSFQVKVNLRTSEGGTDSFTPAISIAAQTGAVTIATPLALNGPVTFNAAVNCNGQIFSGNANFPGNLSIGTLQCGAVSLSGQSCPVNGNPSFTGLVRFDNSLTTFYGAATTVGLLSVNGSLTLNSSVTCNGQTFYGAATFQGVVGFTGQPYASAWYAANAVGAQQFQLTVNANGSVFSLNYYNSGWNAALQLNSGGLLTMQRDTAFNAALYVAQSANISIGSNWTSWSPGLSTGVSYSSYSVQDAEYYRLGNKITFKVCVIVTFTGATNYIALTLPFSVVGGSQVHASMIGQNGNSFVAGACYTQTGSASLLCYLPGWGNYAAAQYHFYVSGTYRCA